MCYLYSVKCLLVIMLDLQNVETSLVGKAKLRSTCGNDKMICYALSNYLKLFSYTNKIVKFDRKYSVKCLFSHFTWRTECLNLTWLVKKLGFACGNDSIIFSMHMRN